MSLLSAIMDLLLYNIGEMATLSHGDVSKPLSGMEMSDRENLILEGDYSILISEGNIIKIRPQQELLEEFVPDMDCLLYTSPSPRDGLLSRMPSSA